MANTSLSQPLTVLWDEAGRSFSQYLPGALSPSLCNATMQVLGDTAPWTPLAGKSGRTTRQTVWYVRNGCRCSYAYGIYRVPATTVDSGPFGVAMEKLTAHVCALLRLPETLWPDCANVNLYEDGSQGVGWHTDDEPLFGGLQHDAAILSLSLGQAREFWAAPKDAAARGPVYEETLEVSLQPGDLVSMEGAFQKNYLHYCPCEHYELAARSPRINITWRWICHHTRACGRGERSPVRFSAHEGPPPTPLAPWHLGRAHAWDRCASCTQTRLVARSGDEWLCRLCLTSPERRQRCHKTDLTPYRPLYHVCCSRGTKRPREQSH